jgi:hypothetical protein
MLGKVAWQSGGPNPDSPNFCRSRSFVPPLAYVDEGENQNGSAEW